MCGIVGFIDSNIHYDAKGVALNMNNSILHRGPDGFGVWQDCNLGVNITHRRLAILDLSSAGHQPMISKSGRYVIVFNGEIYNYKKIALQLENHAGETIYWISHSDTEVILMAFELYGFEKTLSLLEGMFAIALWDRELQQLFLARDRVGEKPLYYGYMGDAFVFTSELKTLKHHPKHKFDINKVALAQFIHHSCIPSYLSIFNGIYKLLPGHYICLNYQTFLDTNLPDSVPYWELSSHVKQSYDGNEIMAANDLDALLHDVIEKQIVADVPVGCFLSGGIDSSLVTAIMQNISGKRVQAFTIGFDDSKYNEAYFAKDVAKHLHVDHHELYVKDCDILDVIPKLSCVYDEPFADYSAIPTYLVSRLARQKVVVSLSGDAGDELFGGYNRHLLASDLYNKFHALPRIIKTILTHGAQVIPVQFINRIGHMMGFKMSNMGDRLDKFDNLLNAQSFEDFYMALIRNNWKECGDLIIGYNKLENMWGDFSKIDPDLSRMRIMQYCDTVGYLPDDILVKVDRAAMANSLETRAPLLNHRVVEFAYSLPDNYKVKNGISKHILRQVLYKYVPKELVERPKCGFGAPINDWLRGVLKPWANDLLSSDQCNHQEYLQLDLIQQEWQQHLTGRFNNGSRLWAALMFQQWLRDWNKI